MSEQVDMRSMGERLKEAFDGLDMKTAVALAFGKCPHCGDKLVRGRWLRWCPYRVCPGYVGPLNKALGNKIKTVLPMNEDEREQLNRIAAEFEVETA